MNFVTLKTAVAEQFKKMEKAGPLFVVNVDKSVIWHSYLSAFPEGSNPIYKTRTEHDCNCCKQFIRAVGNVVSIVDNKIVSIWDVNIPSEPEYQTVANALSLYIKSQPVVGIFQSTEPTAGTDKNFERALSGEAIPHNHFFINIPRQYVVTKHQFGPNKSSAESTFQVLYRGLSELTMDALETTSELIAQNTLYRGAEFKEVLSKFLTLKKKFDKLKTTEEKRNFAWSNLSSPAARINNSAFGTLLNDLSEGMDLEVAVRRYESVMAPTNYQRPTALITKKMVEDAKKKVNELGLASALTRRFAVISDISINDLIYADRNVKKAIGEVDAFDALSATVAQQAPKNFDKVEEVSVEKFIKDFLPNASSVELYVANNLQNHLVSLIAPTDPTAERLFKWDNPFSWSYTGEVADSVKEKVKNAGGNVDGDVCVRLAWNNADDLDLHVVEPNGYEIYFGNRRRKSPNGGELDVDFNGCDKHSDTDPVENIFYTDMRKMAPGRYTVSVVKYSGRSTVRPGYTIDIDIQGNIHHFESSNNGSKTIATIVVEKNGNVYVEGKSVSTRVGPGKEVWGIKTNEFRKVSAVMYSPNYWGDNKVGNRHYFFMLDGCENDSSARGFYNEFLRSEMTQHRKVFEVLAGNNKPQIVENQLSGVGISDTIKTKVTFRVNGKTSRIVNVVF